MAKNKKNCYEVKVERPNGDLITRLTFVGLESDFLAWYKAMQNRFSGFGKNLLYPYYFYPVTEG